MYIKKLLILVNFLFFILLQGQSTVRESEIDISFIDYLKIEVYKSIISSKEFESNKKCHVVGINTVSLNMKYSVGSAIGNYFYDVVTTKDSISVQELRKKLSAPYWLFNDTFGFLEVEYNPVYITTLKKNDSLYVPQKIDFESDICRNSFDIIKIYEPLDKWMNFYTLYYSEQPIKINDKFKGYEVIVPVKYELLKDSFSLEKEKYYLFKIKIGYDAKDNLQIVSEIMK